MKFILIFYIFAIATICNAGLLRRVVRSKPAPDSDSTEIDETTSKPRSRAAFSFGYCDTQQ